mmetsp:Transcript_9134/g.27423  ORF Transcript_9134/g.27423 Transcript_9134/m.27423 type:complete len:304 (+) Transcript_9134:814-1725(+)
MPRSDTIRSFVSGPALPTFVTAMRASNCIRSVALESRTRAIRGGMDPMRCEDVRRAGFMDIRSLAIVCRAVRAIFFSDSLSPPSTFMQEDRHPCWTIVPLTLSSTAMRHIARTTISVAPSVAPSFAVSPSFTSAAGTPAAPIFRIRAPTASARSCSSSFFAISFSSSVLPSPCSSSYCSAVISFPSKASFFRVSTEMAIEAKTDARPYVAVDCDPAETGRFANSTSLSSTVSFASGEARKPCATSSLMDVLEHRYDKTSIPRSVAVVAEEDAPPGEVAAAAPLFRWSFISSSLFFASDAAPPP